METGFDRVFSWSALRNLQQQAPQRGSSGASRRLGSGKLIFWSKSPLLQPKFAPPCPACGGTRLPACQQQRVGGLQFSFFSLFWFPFSSPCTLLAVLSLVVLCGPSCPGRCFPLNTEILQLGSWVDCVGCQIQQRGWERSAELRGGSNVMPARGQRAGRMLPHTGVAGWG